MPKYFFSFLLISACILSGCNDDDKSISQNSQTPTQPSNCKMHCAP